MTCREALLLAIAGVASMTVALLLILLVMVVAQ